MSQKLALYSGHDGKLPPECFMQGNDMSGLNVF